MSLFAPFSPLGHKISLERKAAKNWKFRSVIILQCFRGGCLAQWKHSCFPPSSPGYESRLGQDFFSLLLSLWTVLRSNPSNAKQWISQMQLAVTSAAKYYKILSMFSFGLPVDNECCLNDPFWLIGSHFYLADLFVPSWSECWPLKI